LMPVSAAASVPKPAALDLSADEPTAPEGVPPLPVKVEQLPPSATFRPAPTAPPAPGSSFQNLVSQLAPRRPQQSAIPTYISGAVAPIKPISGIAPIVPVSGSIPALPQITGNFALPSLAPLGLRQAPTQGERLLYDASHPTNADGDQQ
jgi:hypothetical protein